MSNENQTAAGPAFNLHLSAKVGESELHFATNNLAELARVMAFFNLSPGNVAASAPAPTADKAKTKTPAPPAATTAPAPAGTPAPQAPAPAASAPAASGGDVTPEKAATAVREYGAKNGIEKARELLQRHGVDKTANITAEKAPAIYAEATGAAQEL